MKMKKISKMKNNCTSMWNRGHFDRKAQAALALAVSLWIAGGGAAWAEEITVHNEESVAYINCSGDGNTIIVESGGSVTGSGGSDAGASITGGVNNNEITVAGTVRYRVNGGYSDDSSVSGNHVTVSGEVKDYVYGGNSNYGSQVSDNHVIVTGKVNECAYGGRVLDSGSATGNSVTVNGGTVDNHVYGGATQTGSAINNTVTLHNATIGNYVYGGYGSSSCGDKKTGNKLILSGASTARGVYNFATIELPSTLTWSETSPVLSATSFSNCDTLDITSATALANHTAPGTMTLLASNTANDFANMTLKYSTADAAVIPATGQVVKSTAKTSTVNGVGLAYNNTHTVTIANSNKSITYTVANYANKITLGTITWNKNGTARALTAGDYTFNDSTAIDTSSFEFNTPSYLGAGDSMTLLSNATGLTAGDSIAHRQSYTNYDNCIKLNATLNGNITKTANTLGYTATGTTLDSVDLANWNGTTTEVPAGWTSNLGENSITAAGFTAPTINAGESKDILTTTTGNFFKDNQITGALKYKESASSSDTANGVTLTGSESKGVKASDDGKSLIYARSNFNVSNIAFGAMEWGTSRNAQTDGYDFTNANIDFSKLTFTNPESISSGTSTLLVANNTLAAITETAKDVSYSYSPVAGVTVNGTVNGSCKTTNANEVQYTATENKADKLTFGNVEWKDTGALMERPANITFAGAAVDTSNINFTNISELEANKEMTLVGNFGDTVGTITGTKYMVGSTLQGEGKASLEGSNLVFRTDTTAEKMEVQEQTHNTVMSEEVALEALGAGDDFIAAAEDGLGHASNVGADGIASFATMGGGSIRQETGSHVDTRTWNAIIALGHKNEKEKCSFEYGAFFEYGRGNYTTHNGDQRGDGSTYYAGGGLLAKWQKKDGIYVEGSLRAGNVHDDAKNVLRDAMGNPYSYETDAPYWGVHVGVGKVIQLNESSELDVYGKFFHNHRNSVSFDAGGHYDLDAVNSDVLRLGTRYVMKREKWNFYGGLAYEQEFSGKAEGTADGRAIRGADTSGGSLRAELGAVLNPKKDGPITLDFNLSDFAGKKRGLTGGVAVTFNF